MTCPSPWLGCQAMAETVSEVLAPHLAIGTTHSSGCVSDSQAYSSSIRNKEDATRSEPLIASPFLVTAENPLINTLHTLSIFDPLQIPTISRVCSSHSCWESPWDLQCPSLGLARGGRWQQIPLPLPSFLSMTWFFSFLSTPDRRPSLSS